MQNTIVRVFLFVVFFSIGAAAMSGSILCSDLLRYYHNRQALKAAGLTLARLESLNADYDVLLRQLRDDPNFFERIAPATLGVKPADANAIYPRATAEQLAAARKALMEGASGEPVEPRVVVRWLIRCNRPPQRIAFFLSGGFLILISFAFFGPRTQCYNNRTAG